MTAQVLVVVGTDHHPFERLVTWADEFAQQRPDVTVLVQHGSASPPRHAEGAPLLPHDRIEQLFAAAVAVVCHGGPATISDARAAGHRPVVVPRDPAHGEHVDEHQMRFAARLSARHEIECPRDRDELHATLDAILADPTRNAIDPDEDQAHIAAAVANVGRVADRAIAAASTRRRRRWLGPSR